MNTDHDHQWVFGKGFRICDECAKVQLSHKLRFNDRTKFFVGGID